MRVLTSSQLCDAPQATDYLGNWVRERKLTTLEAAVQRLTSRQADIYGFADRGRLVEGAWADVVVFDPETVGPGPVRRVADFPTGSERLTADAPTGHPPRPGQRDAHPRRRRAGPDCSSRPARQADTTRAASVRRRATIALTTPSADAADLPLAPRGYETIRLLGTGGFGEVTLARHAALDRLVAIKYLRRPALADPEALQRFRREAIVLAGLEDPTVVRVHDVRFGDAEPSIIMEYVPGEPLDALLGQGVLSVSEMLVILRDVAHALEVAHGKGIAHRDVKPANVFVLPDGHAKLGDFGLARVATDQEIFRTAADTIGGTPAYLPPEVAMGTGEPGPSGDAYSFAVMAYEMLTGRLPFVGLGIMGLIAAHAQQPIPAPETVLPGFPPSASAALLTALRKDPDQRLSPTELVARLQAVPESSWPEVVRQPIAVGDRTRRVPQVEKTLPAPPGQRRRSKKPWLIAAAAVFFAAAIGIVVGLTGGGGKAKVVPLAVTGVRVHTSGLTGTCPKAVWTFTAELATNGSEGQVRLRWVRPDGKATAGQTVDVRPGQHTVPAVLRFTVTGARPLQGAAKLQVLAPGSPSASSAAVSYSC